jgi:hypothetical protein
MAGLSRDFIFKLLRSPGIDPGASRSDNPIPTQFLALTDCFKIPAQVLYLQLENTEFAITTKSEIFRYLRSRNKSSTGEKHLSIASLRAKK